MKNLALVIAAFLATCLVLELALRIGAATGEGAEDRDAAGVPLHIRVASPELYRLNPEHPRISSQGLRNREVSILKPRGSTRILALGDSITYGPAVKGEDTFAAGLERLLVAEGIPAEVINAGVPGYTPYNELEFYRSQGRAFAADVVMVVFCLNDVANPRLHWDEYSKLGDIPEAAIPNHRYDREVIQPRIAARHSRGGFLASSRLLAGVRRRLGLLDTASPPGVPDLRAETPTYVTGEDDLGIEVLMDGESPEWRWLAAVYRELREEVEADGAAFVIAIVPLAYQLDPAYPYRPQGVFAAYCARHGIPCIDLLEAMSGRSAADLFLMERLGATDVWHLTKQGHATVAAQMARFFMAHPELR
jgi:lysophospholipase L1-like esterase